MRLKQAILEFIANEFQIENSETLLDTSWEELGVKGDQLTDLLRRLQDALGIILPEDQVGSLETVGDLVNLVAEDEI